MKYPIFKFTGKDITQNLVRGKISASHSVIAKAELESCGIHVHKIARDWFAKNTLMFDNLLLLFTQQLALLLKTHLPVAQALALMQTQQHPLLRVVVTMLHAIILRGTTLSVACQNSGYFTAYYCAMIHAGEQSGQLDEVLTHLATEKMQWLIFKAKIKKALAYPLCIFIMAILITILLLIFVVPQFKILFADNLHALPLITRLLFAISHQLNQISIVDLLLYFGSLASLFYYLHLKTNCKAMIFKFFRALPIIGKLLHNFHVIRYLRTLHLCHLANIPILQALTLAEQVADFRLLSPHFNMINIVSEGKSIHQGFSESGLFSPWIIHLISLGEKSGRLTEMLAHSINLIEHEIDNTLQKVPTFVEPAIMIILSILLGTLIIALYLPIFNMGGLY